MNELLNELNELNRLTNQLPEPPFSLRLTPIDFIASPNSEAIYHGGQIFNITT